MKVDLRQVEEAAKELYIRALKQLPPDIKQGFDRLAKAETDAGAKRMLGTMIRNIAVAEDTNNLLCQDTGIPIYNVWLGRGVEVDGMALKEAIRRGCERATREHPLRSSVVHPITRHNEHTSCGRGVPVISVDFCGEDALIIEMVPKGSGSENNSWLRMAVPAEGVEAVKTFVVDCVLEAGGKTCPPTIVGVGIGGTADLCVHLAKVAASFARCTQRSAVPPTPTPTIVGGQVFPPASSTQSTTKVLMASTPSAGTAMRSHELFSEPEPFGIISITRFSSLEKSMLTTGMPRPVDVCSLTRVVGCTMEERNEYSRVERAQPRRMASLIPAPSTSTPRPIHTL